MIEANLIHRYLSVADAYTSSFRDADNRLTVRGMATLAAKWPGNVDHQRDHYLQRQLASTTCMATFSLYTALVMSPNQPTSC